MVVVEVFVDLGGFDVVVSGVPLFRDVELAGEVSHDGVAFSEVEGFVEDGWDFAVGVDFGELLAEMLR